MSRAQPRDVQIELEVIDLAEDGRGVARASGVAGGKVVFVEDALPGERVRARVRRRRRGHDEAQLLTVLSPSPDRVAPRCPHFGVCGGCALQHLAPPAQLRYKHKQVIDALQRVAGVQAQTLAPPVTGPVWGYRRRARLGVKRVAAKGGVIVGFRERHAPLIADLNSCAVLDPRVGERLSAIAAVVERLSIADAVPQIEVATAATVALVLRVLREPSAEDLARLREFSADSGFALYLQRGRPQDLQPLAPDAPPLEYSPDGSELRLCFTPTDFVQVNAEVAQRMVTQALDWLAPEPGERVLELFAGIGNFTLPLAYRGAQVCAVEGDAELVARAQANAQAHGLAIHWVRADLFAPDPAAPWLKQDYRAVLLDPPRAGAREVLPWIAARRPARIVYVSCHPGTLARDAGLLVRDHGYRLSRLGILDMFPHTAHVEAMALFEL